MSRIPFFRNRQPSKGVGGGPERTIAGDSVDQIKSDPHVGVVGMLVGDRKLSDRAAIIAELSIISQTKALKSEEREQLADRILEGKQKLGKAKE